jgi:hypothetical protein
MKNKLILFEINEFDLAFILNGAKKFKYHAIKKFFNKKKIKTFTNDKTEGYNLDPWVQWVSVHTGKASKQHKVFRTGQKLDNSIVQLWDIFSKNNISSSIWGAFNASLRNKNKVDIFFPDPWSFEEEAYPKKFENFSLLPSYYAQNYPAVSKVKILYYILIFFQKIIFSNIILFLIKNFFTLSKIFFKAGFKSFNLYFLLDLLSILIIRNNLKNSPSNFTIIALNSFAHYQHNFWDEKKYHYIYFWYLNQMTIIFEELDKLYDSSIILNGFSQVKIKTEYYIRPNNPSEFLKIFNLKYSSIEPNMTTGATVFFNSFSDKFKAMKFLKSLKIYDYPIFMVNDFQNKKKFFYKFDLVLYEEKIDFSKINFKNYKMFFKTPKNHKSKNEYILLYKNDILKIFENINYIKSTSKHSSEGILLYKNFIIKKKDISKNRILNHKIFKNILSHFRI